VQQHITITINIICVILDNSRSHTIIINIIFLIQNRTKMVLRHLGHVHLTSDLGTGFNESQVYSRVTFTS